VGRNPRCRTGLIYLKIVASDSPSNSAECDAKRPSARASDLRLIIPPPAIQRLEGSAGGDERGTVRWALRMISSYYRHGCDERELRKAQYSVDGGDWILLAPAQGIQRQQDRELQALLCGGLAPGGAHDRGGARTTGFDNVGAGKNDN